MLPPEINRETGLAAISICKLRKTILNL